MNKSIQSLLLVVTAVFLYGCATAPSPNMKLSEYSSTQVSVPSEQALVYFIRPNFLGYLINAAVYDGDAFIGIVPYDQKLPYLAKPGQHTFAVVSESADFMTADLLAGKTYYVEVLPRMGAWKARFSLAPMSQGRMMDANFSQKLQTTLPLKNKPEAYEWAEKNKASVKEKMESNWAKWNEKPEADRPHLRANQGE